MNKVIIAIIGRSGVGKDFITKKLMNDLHMSAVTSLTTRPKRENETDGVEHWFVGKHDFDKIMNEAKVLAYTKIGEYEYCAIYETLNVFSLYIIDPMGLKDLKERVGDDVSIKTIYVKCDKEIRRQRASKRSDFEKEWENRNKAEDEQFKEMEENENWDLIIDTSNDLTDNNDYWKFIQKHIIKLCTDGIDGK